MQPQPRRSPRPLRTPRSAPVSPSRRCGGTGTERGPGGSGAAGRPQQRWFRQGPQDIHTPFTCDLVPSLTLFPLLFPNFSSSNFTLQAVTGKHLTYFTAFQSSLIKSNVYPSNLRAPRCPAVASPGPPSLCCAQESSEGAGEREMPPGSGTGSGTGVT